MKNIKMPKVSTRKEMFYFIYDYLLKNKYHRSSVWSFTKNSDVYRFSSVTRERYIGFGPSAGSYYGPLFTLNTFSVPEYINSINKKGHAVALEMPFTSMLSIIYDFYWRLYDTCIPKERKLDNLSYNLKRVRRLNYLIEFGKMCGMVQENGQVFNLTRKGTFWLHLIQNLFFLRYVNTIWTRAMNTPWPESIKF